MLIRTFKNVYSLYSKLPVAVAFNLGEERLWSEVFVFVVNHVVSSFHTVNIRYDDKESTQNINKFMKFLKEELNLDKAKDIFTTGNISSEKRYSQKFSLENMRKKYSKNKETAEDTTAKPDTGMSLDRTKDWAKGLFADKDGVSSGQNFKDMLNLPRIPASTNANGRFGGLGDF